MPLFTGEHSANTMRHLWVVALQLFSFAPAVKAVNREQRYYCQRCVGEVYPYVKILFQASVVVKFRIVTVFVFFSETDSSQSSTVAYSAPQDTSHVI